MNGYRDSRYELGLVLPLKTECLHIFAHGTIIAHDPALRRCPPYRAPKLTKLDITSALREVRQIMASAKTAGQPHNPITRNSVDHYFGEEVDRELLTLVGRFTVKSFATATIHTVGMRRHLQHDFIARRDTVTSSFLYATVARHKRSGGRIISRFCCSPGDIPAVLRADTYPDLGIADCTDVRRPIHTPHRFRGYYMDAIHIAQAKAVATNRDMWVLTADPQQWYLTKRSPSPTALESTHFLCSRTGDTYRCDSSGMYQQEGRVWRNVLTDEIDATHLIY